MLLVGTVSTVFALSLGDLCIGGVETISGSELGRGIERGHVFEPAQQLDAERGGQRALQVARERVRVQREVGAERGEHVDAARCIPRAQRRVDRRRDSARGVRARLQLRLGEREHQMSFSTADSASAVWAADAASGSLPAASPPPYTPPSAVAASAPAACPVAPPPPPPGGAASQV